jgi:hypothetical protein
MSSTMIVPLGLVHASRSQESDRLDGSSAAHPVAIVLDGVQVLLPAARVPSRAHHVVRFSTFPLEVVEKLDRG